MKISKASAAFTLIELLVVVAIIAILAAIAIPNMLEAQIRAKVSRAKADQRTVVTGLEAYCVDHNKYPTYHYEPNQEASSNMSFHVGGEIAGLLVSPPFNGVNPVTTPVAYLTTFPQDPFAVRGYGDAAETRQFWYVNWDYATAVIPGGGGPAFALLHGIQGTWRLHSPGPDHTSPDTDLVNAQVVYDGTNGSTSRGDIVWTQRQGAVR